MNAGPVVEAAEDGQRFTIRTGAWAGTFPIDALTRQLRFYRSLRDRKGGAYRQFYEPTVLALERFARDLDNAEKQARNPG